MTASLIGALGGIIDSLSGDNSPGALTRLNNNFVDPDVLQQRQQIAQYPALQQFAAQQAATNPNSPTAPLANLAAIAPNIAAQPYANALLEQQKTQLTNPLASALATWNQGKQPAPANPGAAAPASASNDSYTFQPESPDDKRNYDFLNTVVPPAYRAQVLAISNGDESVGNADSLRQNGLLTLATNFDPSISKTDFTARQNTAKDFSSGGKSGQALTSINTATKHLAQVALAGLDLNNGSNQWLNHIENKIDRKFGSNKITNLDSVVQTVAPELAKAAASGGDTTQDERNAQASSFGGDLSPKQLLGTVAGKVDLMQSKADELANSYQKNMGHSAKQIINPENKQTLSDLKSLADFANKDKLDSPEAQAVVQRLRGVVGQTAPSSAAPDNSGRKVIKFSDLPGAK